MSEAHIGPEALRQRIGAIEEAYEYFLAYAAQGRAGDDPSVPIRSFLERAEAALDGLGAVARELVETGALRPGERVLPFLNILDDDARKALAAVRLVLAQPSIGSQLIDNLNASIHLRALLTDLFLVDEVLKARRPE